MAIDLGALNKAFSKIEKESAGAVQLEETYLACERIPCSDPDLHDSMGGGWAFRRIIELFGPPSGGKSNFCYIAGADFQRADHFVAYLDFEKSFDYEYARKQGLNTDPSMFRLLQPNNITEGFQIAEDLIKAGIGLLIIDSVSSMATQAELDADYDKASIGLQAKAMSLGLKKLMPIIADNNVSAIFVNQTRMKIVMMGNPETTSGGEALKFYASLRGRVARTDYIEEAGFPIGYKSKVTWVKNKTFPPKRTAELSIYYATGVDSIGGILDKACDQGLITKGGGGNYSFDDLNGELVKLRGKLTLIDWMKENTEFYTHIKVSLGLEVAKDIKVDKPKAKKDTITTKE